MKIRRYTLYGDLTKKPTILYGNKSFVSLLALLHSKTFLDIAYDNQASIVGNINSASNSYKSLRKDLKASFEYKNITVPTDGFQSLEEATIALESFENIVANAKDLLLSCNNGNEDLYAYTTLLKEVSTKLDIKSQLSLKPLKLIKDFFENETIATSIKFQYDTLLKVLQLMNREILESDYSLKEQVASLCIRAPIVHLEDMSDTGIPHFRMYLDIYSWTIPSVIDDVATSLKSHRKEFFSGSEKSRYKFEKEYVSKKTSLKIQAPYDEYKMYVYLKNLKEKDSRLLFDYMLSKGSEFSFVKKNSYRVGAPFLFMLNIKKLWELSRADVTRNNNILKTLTPISREISSFVPIHKDLVTLREHFYKEVKPMFSSLKEDLFLRDMEL